MREVKDMKVIASDNEEAIALFTAFYAYVHTFPYVTFDEKYLRAFFSNGSTLVFVGDRHV